MARCNTCKGNGHWTSRDTRTRKKVQGCCSACEGTGYFDLDQGCLVANQLVQLGQHAQNGWEIMGLYARCLETWYASHWNYWLERQRNGWKVCDLLSFSYDHPVVQRFEGPIPFDLPMVPICPCKRSGGCWHCGGRFCLMCNYDEDDYLDEEGRRNCPGSRDGACRSTGCDICRGSNRCSRCGN